VTQLLPIHFRTNPFKGELSDQEFQQTFAQHVCFSVLDDNAIIAITDAAGKIAYANHGFVKISKYPLETLIGADHRILNSGHHPKSYFKDMYREIAKGRKWRGEIRNRAMDGSHYWVDTTIVPIIGNRAKILGYAAIRIDITSRKEAEARHFASEERFRHLTTLASDWFWEMDADFRFTQVSTGIGRADLAPGFFLGKAPWELPMDCEGMTMDEHRSALETRHSFRDHIYRVTGKDGAGTQWLRISGRPLFDSQKRCIGFRGVGRCITARFLKEREIREQADLLHAIKRSFPGGFAVVDADMKVIDSNKQFRAIMKLPDNLFERNRADMRDLVRYDAERGDFGSGDVDQIVEERLQKMRVDKAIAYEYTRADGTAIEVRAAPLKDGGWVKTYVDVTERRRTQEHVEYLAGHDALTSLLNRRQFRQKVGECLATAARTGQGFSLLLIDLDRFKQVNDVHGHPTGDTLLTQVAERLREGTRPSDMIARLGGDEFAVVLKACDPQSVGAIAQRLIKQISEPYLIEEKKLVIGASIGATIAPLHGKRADQLIKKADMALYHSKESGRGTWKIFDSDLQAHVTKRVSIENDLRDAIERNEFELYYQPQIDLTSDLVTGFEALLRWKHPTKGMIAPQSFISIAEESGLIHPIGAWVVRKACETAASWPDHMKVAVNVSPSQLHDENFFSAVEEALATSGLPAWRLELEVTESGIMKVDGNNLARLYALRKRGVTIALDDFGTGYSSLTNLQQFEVDKIKIDRSFLMRLPDCKKSLTFLRAIVLLAKGFGLETTAEGVEDPAQLDLVRAEGCTQVQGYLLGVPRPDSACREMIKRFQSGHSDCKDAGHQVTFSPSSGDRLNCHSSEMRAAS
jgi:diguanylate cyclase (GGDEF)-like protein/PAS domain S-box-containing protein